MRLCRPMCGKASPCRQEALQVSFIFARLSLAKMKTIRSSLPERQSLSAHRVAKPHTTCCFHQSSLILAPRCRGDTNKTNALTS